MYSSFLMKMRLFGFWTFAAIVAGGCSAPDKNNLGSAGVGLDPGTQKTVNSLLVAGIAGIFIAVSVLVALWVSSRKWPPSYRGGFVGCVFGLVVAAVIIRRIPLETQLVAIGTILGFGADFAVTLRDPEGPKTAINRLAKMIAGMISEVGTAAKDTGLRKPREAVIAGGLWCFLGTILFTLVIGNLF
jgi:hypothetical protein